MVNFDLKFMFMFMFKLMKDIVFVVMEMVVKKVFVMVDRNVIYKDFFIENVCKYFGIYNFKCKCLL